MKKRVLACTITLILFLILCGSITVNAENSASISIAGEWQATFTTMIGEMKCHYTFKVNGNVLTGTVIAEMSGNKSESEITEGKIDGDKITFAWNYNNQVNMVTNGKVNGDNINLTRQAGSYGSESAVATRIPSGGK